MHHFFFTGKHNSQKINRELSAVDKSEVDIARFESKGPDFLRFKRVGVWTPLSLNVCSRCILFEVNDVATRR